jgi:hypothetical protein
MDRERIGKVNYVNTLACIRFGGDAIDFVAAAYLSVVGNQRRCRSRH